MRTELSSTEKSPKKKYLLGILWGAAAQALAAALLFGLQRAHAWKDLSPLFTFLYPYASLAAALAPDNWGPFAVIVFSMLFQWIIYGALLAHGWIRGWIKAYALALLILHLGAALLATAIWLMRAHG